MGLLTSQQLFLIIVRLDANIWITSLILLKINRESFTPGQHLPIISPEKGMTDSVDYAFLGAWNFKNEIIKKEKRIYKKGW